MKKIFIINGGQKFEQSGGRFNETLTRISSDFFKDKEGFEVKTTDINESYRPKEEAEKFVWADVVIYHMPVWWFQIPHKLKEYLDHVLEHGKVYGGDGRSSANPAINYGTGGLLQGKKYMVTTSWNAPKEAFTLPGEFFGQKSVDEGILFGFHRMNAFIGMEALEGIHFHDIVKNGNVERDMAAYKAHLEKVFSPIKSLVLKD
ncbi:NAD(P)H-dependent oxidoreductase [Sinomicrobium weinanense]|uniref:NAD(P)H-dependent oxidoreductase n=1 Tax=Sinomicrobium weinanense TaxID=2842200 RepID=A0A926JTA2_9FLAO|nr:NAD(P)H-dependent oxidoreductase [Sinomicrobium weinanense]MBC9797098.1 NAD(P)H-dependent oxidoreductase [Sinomicrobium weinanense]MBU3124794.1 NAD(P)H-dependent oxidoreductase [Sinomicrobium weinanense]